MGRQEIKAIQQRLFRDLRIINEVLCLVRPVEIVLRKIPEPSPMLSGFDLRPVFL